MKKTTSLLLGLALLASTSGCYCWPFYGGGMGMYPYGGCPPGQPTPITPAPVGTSYNTIDVPPVATPMTMLPAPTPMTMLPAPTPVTVLPAPATTPIVLETLPTFR